MRRRSYATVCQTHPAHWTNRNSCGPIDEPAVKSGSGVFIKVQMTNISDHAVDCTAAYLGATDRKYQYDVRDDAGTSIKRRIIRPEQDAGSIEMCTLQPGESTHRETQVSWLHDLTKPGKYTIQLMRGAAGDEKDGVVKSNIVTVTVTP
jgi:hypothetical protein